MNNYMYNSNLCKHSPKLMFKCDGVSVFAGSKYEIYEPEKFGVIFNLSGFSVGHKEKVVTGTRKWESLNKHFIKEKINEVVIDWMDGQSLRVGKEFWLDLWKMVLEEKAETICFCCMGGHGRTGTAIAALWGLVLGVSPAVAIRETRNRICAEAVETETQERYVYSLLGVAFPEKHRIEKSSTSTRVVRCGACGAYKVDTIHIGNHDFCNSCIHKEFDALDKGGAGRAKKVKDCLISKADARDSEGGPFGNKGKEVKGKKNGTGSKGEKGGFDVWEMICDVCDEETTMLYQVDIEDIPGAMVCVKCKDTYYELVENEAKNNAVEMETNKTIEESQVPGPYGS